MIVYKSCLYVIMVLFCMVCVVGFFEEDMEDWVWIDFVVGGYYFLIFFLVQICGVILDGEMLKDRLIFLLEDGSMICLVVYDDVKNLLEEYFKVYLVCNVGMLGSSLFYFCEVDDNGVVIFLSSIFFYMKVGIYYFRILLFVKVLNLKGFVNIGNGEYLFVIDDWYM